MSQYRSAYQTQPPRNTPLKSLATKIAVAALMITGSAGIVVAATSSSAHPAAPAAAAVNNPIRIIGVGAFDSGNGNG